MKPYLIFILLLLPLSMLSAESMIQEVRIQEVAPNTFTFFVTLKSPDSGWDYYADGWQVVDNQTGKVYGTRVLAHPHTEEQPFTRSETMKIPTGVSKVSVVAKMSTDTEYPKRDHEVTLKSEGKHNSKDSSKHNSKDNSKDNSKHSSK